MTVAIRRTDRTVIRRASLPRALVVVLAGVFVATSSAEVLETATTDRMPLNTVVPVYPEKARRERIEGAVQVCFEITRDGRTRRIAVRKSTHRIFEKPAKRAVKESTYVPLSEDAELAFIKACRTFRFSLEPVVTEEVP